MNMNVLILGRGSIGSHLIQKFEEKNHRVIVATRDFNVHEIPKVKAVIWCQGVNCNDSVGSLNYSTYMNTIDVNLHYITKTLDKLEKGSRCLIISSLWQEFSYTVSKAALGGVVQWILVRMIFS